MNTSFLFTIAVILKAEGNAVTSRIRSSFPRLLKHRDVVLYRKNDNNRQHNGFEKIVYRTAFYSGNIWAGFFFF